MRVVIVGGGKVGGYLARQLLDNKHAVTVIESDPVAAERLAEDIASGLVIEGDGTDVEVLNRADVDRADWLLAVSGQDEVNLVACELAETLGARRTLARLNDPRNRAAFDALGLLVVGVTDLMGEVIERELDKDRFERITMFGAGAISVIEVEIPVDLVPRRVIDLDLPPESLIITVIDLEGTAVVPGADTVIRAGSRVVAVTTLDREPQVRDALMGIG